MYLLYNPKSIGISRHMQVQDLAPVVGDDEKAVQNTKREPLGRRPWLLVFFDSAR